MKNIFKGKIATAIILLSTFVLAGVAIFTAIRLYQLRQTAVAPNVPSSIPRAAEDTCSLSFTISSPTVTATATATATSTATATATATSTATATATATTRATATATSGATAVPTATATVKPATNSTSTPTPTQPALPQSGTDWPTVLGIGIGILTIVGSLLLAL